MQDAHDLGVTVDSGTPIIVVETFDESNALDLVRRVANVRDLPFYQWTITDGLNKGGIVFGLERKAEHQQPEEVLHYIKHRAEPGVYVLCDMHHWLVDEPKHIRLLKDFAIRNRDNRKVVVLLSHRFDLPPELSRLSARFQLSLPTHEQILDIVKQEANQWGRNNHGVKVKTDKQTLQQLVVNLQGLTDSEVRQVARGAIIDDGAISASDLPEVSRAKFRLMDMEGVLHYEYDTAKFAEIGGMDALKSWLEKRRAVFASNQSAGIEPPKGIMLTGVQGGGKSLAAKAVAGLWGVPLLRLDMSALYNKYHGETERNLRESLKLAEKMAPCILWIDEIEKGVSSDANDSGVSKRVLGSLLTWMAEHKAKVFTVATANDISRLPPELVRKGRFDELFFVDLPCHQARARIFDIHLRKRMLDPTQFNVAQLVTASAGFSGAEIEQAVVSAVYTAISEQQETSTTDILSELNRTSPLSVVMEEKLTALRLWARERAMVQA